MEIPKERDFAKIKANFALMVADQETASALNYTTFKQSDGKYSVIEGGSIRLAEIIRNVWGHFNVEEVGTVIDRDAGYVEVLVKGHDLIQNVSETASVRASIKPNWSNMLVETTRRACLSKAKRNVILALIPTQLFASELRIAKENAGKLKKSELPLLLNEFASHGVAEKDVFKALGVKDIHEVKTDHMIQLLGAYNAISDGNSAKEVFGGNLRELGSKAFLPESEPEIPENVKNLLRRFRTYNVSNEDIAKGLGLSNASEIEDGHIKILQYIGPKLKAGADWSHSDVSTLEKAKEVYG